MFGIKGDGRREEEGGVRRKGARRRSKMKPLKQKVRRKCNPSNRNKAESTSDGGSKMRPLRQKVRRKCDPLRRNRADSTSGGGQKCDPLGRKCVENATLRQK